MRDLKDIRRVTRATFYCASPVILATASGIINMEADRRSMESNKKVGEAATSKVQTDGALRLACVYDVMWQCIRVGCLAENNTYGGFGTCVGVERNKEKCDAYLSEPAAIGQERFWRLWRVMNLWDACLLSNVAGTEHGKLITKYHFDYHWAFQQCKRAGYDFAAWDWGLVESQLCALYRRDQKVFGQIERNLLRRVQTANRRVGGLQHRNELARFLGLIQLVKEGQKK